ncbi:uncharacterized protein YbcV (DUF1398 family) [Wenyingzhuangia heitensis]|uniref:Uncharacterized protein YbcV (DUF1398 family) n=1 Tax=Wenyingzhuangia heitensis TaxID=1487859 RepID=A0ABX0U8Q4_9FLAO|nr:hypothetical protein [Wenyingzhuangia heitensis]NIJ45207.1 uncharacterized protein YbcV (DUF1398 family) [Wenyingzhuangia heitensis]
MKYIKNVVIKSNDRSVMIHRVLQNKRSILTQKLLKINSLLNRKDKNLIEDMNDKGVCLEINYPSCDWSIKNANKQMLNRIFG